MSEVVQIDEMRIRRARKQYIGGGCKHMNLTADEEGDIVTCDDCGKQVSAFWALQMMAEHFDRAMTRLERDRAAHDAAAAQTVTLRAAQKVERAWRSRSMVPSCPHCGSGIFQEDGLGGSMVNREMELRRRQVAAEKRKAEP